MGEMAQWLKAVVALLLEDQSSIPMSVSDSSKQSVPPVPEGMTIVFGLWGHLHTHLHRIKNDNVFWVMVSWCNPDCSRTFSEVKVATDSEIQRPVSPTQVLKACAIMPSVTINP